MPEEQRYRIDVSVTPRYLAEQSEPEQKPLRLCLHRNYRE